MNYMLYFVKKIKFLTERKPPNDLLTRIHDATLSSGGETGILFGTNYMI